jgi:hypothetical protein
MESRGLEEVKIELLETRGGDSTSKHLYEHAIASEAQTSGA